MKKWLKISQVLFLEAIIAPSITKNAIEIFKTKKNLRVLVWEDMKKISSSLEIKSISGGFLTQSLDEVSKEFSPDWRVLGKNPTLEIKKDLVFAWKVAAHLKSNAIAVCKNLQTLGLGMGQVSRIRACELAFQQKAKFHKEKKGDLVLASDGFFPFPDSIEMAQREGISWIIQPGGSIQDEKVIKKAQELGLNMVLTGQRHFKH